MRTVFPKAATQHVMVVDDDPDVREVLMLLLNKAGFDTVGASNGAQCLRLLRSVKPAVILLDLMMPGMDGFEVCEAIRRDQATAAIPVIIVTSRDDNASRMRAARLGVSDFLVKPVSSERLVNRIRAQIEIVEAMNRTQAAIERLTAESQSMHEAAQEQPASARSKARRR
jgi:DNA-binding response OmpR family regulator